MDNSSAFNFLLGTAISIGFFHTLVGVDHSLPFVLIGRARNWPLRKVLGLTAICGIGHVLSSVLLGAIGITFGVALEKLNWVESSRGALAANLLIGFGLCYGSYALWRAIRNKPHSHGHLHDDGTWHDHTHQHHQDHLHVHASNGGEKLTAWSLFVIFVFGPCEALIPLLMAPAATHHWSWVVLITLAFSLTTLATMLLVVGAAYLGLRATRFKLMEKFSHAIAGYSIAGSGIAIQVLGI